MKKIDENLLPFEKIKREVFTKKDVVTNPKYGKKPEKRSVDELLDFGIINIDKPAGPTSHQVSAYVKDIIGIKKAGHSGTLDPNVTGSLPVALGRGTRVLEALLTSGKEYVCLMHVHKEIPNSKIKEVMNSFLGKIKQLPPVKSAVKRDWRYRKIYYLEILEIEGQDVLFRVGTQAGTYIRKLVHDIGVELGCGAHMAELRRSKTGPFREDTLCSLQELSDTLHFYKENGEEEGIRRCVLPIEFGVDHLPKVWVLDTTVNTLCHGVNLKVPGIAKVESEIQIDEDVAIMTLKDELVGVGKLKMLPKNIISKDKGVAVQTKKVFMEPGTYPKIEK
ncbi:RNA-guided pseudouridylation complex pseudouridine synthase subunit Cbf5 [Candidatus Woesearchaeota archaeon]|nr:RNA-guided pseudouridylation complex pseudouridine synthase subunit Cbf5 [Candidatus Woesearchaeota archaeon]